VHLVNHNELRYRVISTLLQADRPLTLPQIAAGCGPEASSAPDATLLAVLEELSENAQVVQGTLLPDLPAPQFAWRTRWELEAQSRASLVRQELRSSLETVERVPPAALAVDSRPSVAFHRYLISDEYAPPQSKRYLVFLQCSVRRPFSTAPSHAPMRRAIRTATGYDPRQDLACPVHVVVLASKIGPVPYELEDLYPANVRGGGVKHLDRETYQRVKPILAKRMADYLRAYGPRYEQITSFTEGRYADVLEQAQVIMSQQAEPSRHFTILPRTDGPVVTRMNKSRPRQYWARYWIQLYLEIAGWLDPDQQRQADARLSSLRVEYRA
jgi:hypothetical protein